MIYHNFLRRSFRRITYSLFAGGLAASMLFAVQDLNAASKATTPLKGTRMYTKFSLYYEDLCHRTTNYRKGILVPANTEVAFVRANKKEIIVTLPGGENLKIENIQAFSGEGIDGIFTRTFSTEKLDLGKFTEDEQKSIKRGEVKPGMTRAAVIVALGYPPKHKTPSLESDQWRYWRNRFNTFVVNFDDGKVTGIKN